MDLSGRILPDTIDRFDGLPDSVILFVFNKIGDVKALSRCSAVSRRFCSLVSQVDDVVVRVDCVGSDLSAAASGGSDKSRHPISSLFRSLFSGLFKPLQSLSQLITSSLLPLPLPDCTSTTHHPPAQVLRNFNEIKLLRVQLPRGELGIDDGVLLKWKANFGSTLDRCVVLSASSVIQNMNTDIVCSNADAVINTTNDDAENDDYAMPESFYTNGELRLRVVRCLMAASARHYLLQPIIAEHKTLENLVLRDGDGQGVLSMNKEQLEEVRGKPSLLASSESKRTSNMLLWYAPQLELPNNGVVLKGVTLVLIRPTEQPNQVLALDTNWVESAFEEPFTTAARVLMKRKAYCLGISSF